MIPKKNTFCIAPFKHACLNSVGNLRVCCASQEKSNFKYYDLDKWYKSETLKSLRQNLVKGIRDPICARCWTDEDNNKISRRNIYNKHLGGILTDNFDKSFQKNTILKKLLSNSDHTSIDTFDFKLGNHCNLKCIMCDPKSSSEILLEAKKNKEIANFYDIPDSKDFVWAKEKEFKSWCVDNLHKATYAKFTGGEPFLNPYLLDTIKNIPKDQRKKCILHFVTNLTIMNAEILSILSSFKETWINVSVEGIGDVLEYARFGHKWTDLQDNLLKIKSLQNKNIHLIVAHVIQSPTFYGIPKLVEYFDREEIMLEPIFLDSPDVFKLQSIKTFYKKELLQRFEHYNNYNKSYVNSLVSFVKNNLDHDQNLANRCVERLKVFDKHRKTNFQNLFPIDYFL